MSYKIFQTLVYQMRDVIKCEFGILDENGIIIACSDESRVNSFEMNYQAIIQDTEQITKIEKYAYEKVIIKNKVELIVYITNISDEYINYLRLLAINAYNMKSLYDERYDKKRFIKNIIVNNIMPGEQVIRSRELHLDINAMRVVFLINTDKMKEVYVHDIIQGLFPNRSKDFVIIIDEENVALIKELHQSDGMGEIDKLAKIIYDNLSTELMVKVQIGVGTVVDNIKDLTRTYKEAKEAMVVGRIFESDKNIFHYSALGIGRLIYQIPITMCELFLSEVFKENSIDILDSETMITITKFFENDLNVSEASRELYVHRNTLVYRLEKILKNTGLDLTKFDDAVIFKVAILVKKYLSSKEDL